ncbi:MAG: prephenate dehydratase [Thermodesulfobacteriota bacterium]|nr:prephenate dehydratase [Thermodesulfobacteriota bacterium]
MYTQGLNNKKGSNLNLQRELDVLRGKIDQIDTEILDLLNERAKTAIKIAKTKIANNLDFYAPDRELKIYERLISINRGPFPNKAIKPVFKEIISASLSLEKHIHVLYLGPKATFTHLASISHFGQSSNFIEKRNIPEIFSEVERDRADFGVVPVENSTEGVVSNTLDMFIESNLKISAEILLEISHHLMSKTGRMEDIKKVYSHPHAIAQCRNWLDRNLPNIPIIDVASTASAAKSASDDMSVAAIASEYAASYYDLKIVKRKTEDNINNFTRFLVIGKSESEKSGNDKTSIMFSIKDEVGILYRMLEPFAKNNVNLTKIESRPLKKRAWEYMFFLDMEGHIFDKNVKKALEELDEKSLFLKVLGSYPRSS